MEMEMLAKGELYISIPSHKLKKFYYDEKRRIKIYAEMATYGFAIANMYEYPDDETKPIICHFYYYVTHLEKVPDPTKSRWDKTQFYEHLYEIALDLKTITEYNTQNLASQILAAHDTCGVPNRSDRYFTTTPTSAISFSSAQERSAIRIIRLSRTMRKI